MSLDTQVSLEPLPLHPELISGDKVMPQCSLFKTGDMKRNESSVLACIRAVLCIDGLPANNI